MAKIRFNGESITKKIMKKIHDENLTEFTSKQFAEEFGKKPVNMSILFSNLKKKGVIVQTSHRHYKLADDLEIIWEKGASKLLKKAESENIKREEATEKPEEKPEEKPVEEVVADVFVG